MKPIAHGGDLAAISRRYPDAPQPWLDLSTGINPIAYPVGTIAGDTWSRLPSHDSEQQLIAAAAARYGVNDAAQIVAAPGAQALIQLLPRLLPRSRVAIIGPTYQEHEAAWRRHRHHVTVVEKLAQIDDAELAVVVNPDNPTGRILAPQELRACKVPLIVDESFADFLPSSSSLANDLPKKAIVLRSFGKAYGLAGLRLGFAVAEPDLAARLREELGPWAVSGPALEIGRVAFGDQAWLQQAARRLASDAAQLDNLLAAAGFTLVGGAPLFRLARHSQAPAMAERLGRRGIHVRTFEHQPDWIRFGLPGTQEGFRRVAEALGVRVR